MPSSKPRKLLGFFRGARPADAARLSLDAPVSFVQEDLVEFTLGEDDGCTLSRLQLPIKHRLSDPPNILWIEASDVGSFVDILQRTLTEADLGGHDDTFRKSLSRILVRALIQFHRLPSNLFIHGVHLQSRDAVASGGFGDIFKGTYLGKEVALKRIRVRQEENGLVHVSPRLYREIVVWQSLDHPHVLPFYGVEAFNFSPLVCMVAPWMHNGSLLQYVQQGNRSEWDINKLLYETAQAIDYLHSRSIVHGDVRCSNVLIDRSGYAKLADFGLSILLAERATTATTSAGSYRWSAPELFTSADAHRTRQSDIYAFGCTCLEAHTGQPPLPELKEFAVVAKVISGARPQWPQGCEASAALRSLAEECWRPAGLRPSGARLLNKMHNVVAPSPYPIASVSDTAPMTSDNHTPSGLNPSYGRPPEPEVIALYREALQLHKKGEEERNGALVSLSKALYDQYEQTRNIDCLDEAIALCREVCDQCSEEHPQRHRAFHILGIVLEAHYKHTGDEDSFRECVSAYHVAMELRQEGHPERHWTISNLGVVMQERYKRAGDKDALQQASVLLRKALILRPEGHSHHLWTLEMLAFTLEAHYGEFGDVGVLDETVVLYRAALLLRSEGDSARETALASLSRVLLLRGRRSRDRTAFEEVIALDRAVLALRPEGHPERHSALNNLGLALYDHYVRTRDQSALDEAITQYRAAVALFPDEDPYRARCLKHLAIALEERSRLSSGQPGHIPHHHHHEVGTAP